jgi:hypothetical protein
LQQFDRRWFTRGFRKNHDGWQTESPSHLNSRGEDAFFYQVFLEQAFIDFERFFNFKFFPAVGF